MKIRTIKTIHERVIPEGFPTVTILRERTVRGEREPQTELERALSEMGLLEFS